MGARPDPACWDDVLPSHVGEMARRCQVPPHGLEGAPDLPQGCCSATCVRLLQCPSLEVAFVLLMGCSQARSLSSSCRVASHRVGDQSWDGPRCSIAQLGPGQVNPWGKDPSELPCSQHLSPDVCQDVSFLVWMLEASGGSSVAVGPVFPLGVRRLSASAEACRGLW